MGARRSDPRVGALRASGRLESFEAPVLGMDGGGCVQPVRQAVADSPGAHVVEVVLAA